jgi:hypothetical protein
MNQPEKLDLSNIDGGGLMELAGRELERIVENIADPNTKTDAARELTIKVKIKPDEKGMSTELSYSVTSKMPGAQTSKSRAWLAMGPDKRLGLFAIDTRQQPLFGGPEALTTEIKPVAGNHNSKVAEMPAPAFAPPMTQQPS